MRVVNGYEFYCHPCIRFNIVCPLVAQNLTKSVEEFSWESFELWLDLNSTSLITCQQNREMSIGASLGDERVESSKSSLFPLPYPRGNPTRDPERPFPREKRGAYLTDGLARSIRA